MGLRTLSEDTNEFNLGSILYIDVKSGTAKYKDKFGCGQMHRLAVSIALRLHVRRTRLSQFNTLFMRYFGEFWPKYHHA